MKHTPRLCIILLAISPMVSGCLNLPSPGASSGVAVYMVLDNNTNLPSLGFLPVKNFVVNMACVDGSGVPLTPSPSVTFSSSAFPVTGPNKRLQIIALPPNLSCTVQPVNPAYYNQQYQSCAWGPDVVCVQPACGGAGSSNWIANYENPAMLSTPSFNTTAGAFSQVTVTNHFVCK